MEKYSWPINPKKTKSNIIWLQFKTIYGTNTNRLHGFSTRVSDDRQKGYAITKGEFHHGIQSVAAPIFERTGQVRAAINVVATEATFNQEFIEKIALPKVLEASEILIRFYGLPHKN